MTTQVTINSGTVKDQDYVKVECVMDKIAEGRVFDFRDPAHNKEMKGP